MIASVSKKPQLDKKISHLDEWDYVEDDVLRKYESEYSELIGQFIIDFSYLDHYINGTIADFLTNGSFDTAYTIVENLSMRNKIDLFHRFYAKLASFKNHWAKKRIKTIYTELTRLNTFRNYIAHADWQTLDKDGFVRVKIVSDNDSGFIHFQNVKITPEIIIANIKAISDIVDKIDKHMETARNF